MRRKAFLALTAALLAWTAFAAALEIHRTRWIVVHDPWAQPSQWRFRSRHVDELRELLEAARRHLPAGAVVGVVDDPEASRESFFRYLWIAYLLPDHELRHAGLGDPRAGAEYWIAADGRVTDPRFEVLMETDRGGVYRGPRGEQR
jgi:hypothetical protein